MPFHVQPLILISVANGFAKNADAVSRKKNHRKRSEMLQLYDIAACTWRATGHMNALPFSNGRSGENAGMNIRDYSPPQDGFAGANLIQSPSRIKRASRHVPFISIRN
jgi:hypothetical protein